MSGEGKVVCVTGASGFIASWLVKLLLERNYTVKATVRDPNDPKIKHLHELDGTKERLHILRQTYWKKGLLTLQLMDVKAELIDPAVKGTLNVLRSCAKVQSVKRVVITSSIASILFNGNPLTPDVVVDETWFSSTALCRELKNRYLVSKTLAEEASWKFAKENGVDLVTLHPGLVIGPFLHSTLNLSLEVILDITNDVAFAHIQALEVPKASGRYLLVGRVTQFCQILKILHEHYPTLQLPEKLEAAKYEQTYQISQERAKSLGINFMPWEVSLRDTVECFKEKGFFNV
ncbi:hypothetical protein Pint_23946 [Pistacia integerrima]|uniref:Uncharacterized protein n=1 Tax=Pistacia integerrima TaxID=434235 RepID=A0ACC0YI58_9ROSI|nr:hypothetical protein Pint_23946 [Pistacia integerrima]